MMKKRLINQLKSSRRVLSLALLMLLLPLGAWAQEAPAIYGIDAFPTTGLTYSLSFGWEPSSDFDQLYYKVNDGEETRYNQDEDSFVEKPCRVDAYIKNNDGIIAGTQKTLYVYAFSSFTGTAVYGQSATLPGFAPALAGSESVSYSTYSTDVVDVDESNGQLTVKGVGVAYIQAYIEEQDADYFVYSDTTNYQLTVLPPAPEIASATLEGEEIEISISNSPNGAQIYYSWDANDDDGYEYAKITPKAQNGTLYAWVVARDAPGNSFRSEKTSKLFEVKRSMENAEITLNGESFTYTGSEIKPEVTVTYSVVSMGATSEIELVEGTDYTVSYMYNVNVPEDGSNFQPHVVITGAGDYTGETTAWFSIEQADFSKISVAPIEDQPWLGTAIEPELTVTFNGNPVSSDEYGVEYESNDDIGDASVLLYCNEKNFHSEDEAPITVPFKIVQAKVAITAEAEQRVTYDGDSHEVVASVDEEGALEYTYYDSEDARSSKQGGTSEPPTDAGTYYVTVTFSGEYYVADPVEVTLYIDPKPLSEEMVTLSETEFTYTGEVQKPEVTVADDDIMTGNDYVITNEGGTDAGDYEVVVEGANNYTGTVTKTFTIQKTMATVTKVPNALDLVYTGEAQELVEAGEAVGGVLVYSLSEDGDYNEDIPTGTDAQDYIIYYKVIGDDNHEDSQVGSVEVTIAANVQAELTVTLEPESYVYDGTEKKPGVTVKADEATLTEDVDYTLSYENNTNAGTATVTVTGIGNYAGAEKTVEFLISKAEAGLEFSVDEVTVVLNGTLTAPVLSNPNQLEVTYSSSNEAVATVDAETGEVTLAGPGETTITATAEENDNYEGGTASYVLTVMGHAYPLTVGGVVVTEENRTSLFNGSVSYVPETNLLMLKDAELNGGIEVSSGINGLIIHLEGTNSITGSAIVTSSQTLSSLEFQQNGSGSLTFNKSTSGSLAAVEDAFVGVVRNAIFYSNNLTAELLSDQSGVRIACLLEPILDESGQSTQVNPASDLAGLTTQQLAEGYEKNGIYYTLPDENDGTIPGENTLALNSQMSQEDVERIAKNLEDGINLPGTSAFNSDFHGLALLLNAGSYEIEMEVRTGDNTLNVMIGTEAPLHLKASDDFQTYNFTVVVDRATYVLIYSYPSNTTDEYVDPSVSRRAPGRKLATTTELKSIKAKASSVNTAPTPRSDYKKLKKGDIVIPLSGGHIVIDDMEVTDLDDDVFEELRDMNAAGERRAFGTSDYTYIDLRATGIVGMNYDRESGPFRNIPLNTFIYLPSGNIVGSPNMIVGSVCKDVQLSPDHEFEAAYDFDAAKLTLKRAFSDNEKQSVCLPFDIQNTDDYGQFFSFDKAKDGTVQMKKANKVEANKAYFLQAKEGGFSSLIVANASVIAAEPETPATGLVGTYSATNQSGVYVYDNAKKEFKRMSSSDFLPFEAYLRLTGFGDALAANWEGEATAIDALRMNLQQDGAWYTLDGRKLEAVPTQKGVYLHNGKKIVVK